jgi:hypothetical protein
MGYPAERSRGHAGHGVSNDAALAQEAPEETPARSRRRASACTCCRPDDCAAAAAGARSGTRHDQTPEERLVSSDAANGAPRSRRSLLKLLGVATLGLAGGAATRTESARATDGAALVVGQTNTASQKTLLANSGAISNDGAFVVNATAADWAIEGTSGQLGVFGSGFIGVMGSGDVGGFFSGTLAAISLQPQDLSGAPTSGDYSKGDLLVDADGVMFMCVVDGNPGSWIKVSHGGYRSLAAPVRAYDSRQAGGKLRAGDGDTASPRAVQITGVVPSVPPNAVAVAGNLTVTQADGSGFAAIWPGGAWPGTSNINYGGADLANAFTVGLTGTGSVSVAAWVPVHVIIDIAGYIL